jgi:hypothetical protein
MRSPTHIESLDDSHQTARSSLLVRGRSDTAATEGQQSVLHFIALRRHLRRPLMFSALFYSSTHSGFGSMEFWTYFRRCAVHKNPEMGFVLTYSIYRHSLNG